MVTHYGTITVWIESPDESDVWERTEKIIDAINGTGIPCSVSEDVGEYVPHLPAHLRDGPEGNAEGVEASK